MELESMLRLKSLVEKVENRELDPYTAADIMENEALSHGWLPH